MLRRTGMCRVENSNGLLRHEPGHSSIHEMGLQAHQTHLEDAEMRSIAAKVEGEVGVNWTRNGGIAWFHRNVIEGLSKPAELVLRQVGSVVGVACSDRDFDALVRSWERSHLDSRTVKDFCSAVCIEHDRVPINGLGTPKWWDVSTVSSTRARNRKKLVELLEERAINGGTKVGVACSAPNASKRTPTTKGVQDDVFRRVCLGLSAAEAQ